MWSLNRAVYEVYAEESTEPFSLTKELNSFHQEESCTHFACLKQKVKLLAVESFHFRNLVSEGSDCVYMFVKILRISCSVQGEKQIYNGGKT